MVIKIPLKALSVNAAWQGRRFKTKTYKDFETDCFKLIRGTPTKGNVEIHYRFYLKNHKATDIDNLIKPIQDILVKCGLIEDDRRIMRIVAEKFKGENTMEISISEFN